MNKAIICSPEEMNPLQYVEESNMTFEERLMPAFGVFELSKALSPKDAVDFQDDSEIDWITLHMRND
ncbi:MAG: hypothetical protein JJE09_15160 [Bacteroidia bacterium]|nr:hypothetical protein [Bacteroidia bacterium]